MVLAPLRPPRSVSRQPATPTIAFIFFLLVNAVLVIRPSEIIPAVAAWNIYEWVILACLAVSFPAVLGLLSPTSLSRQPITVCVLCLLPAILLSHLTHGNLYSARWTAFEFFKVVVYYLLFMANVSSASRLRLFLVWMVGLVAVLTVIALLQYHGVIDIPALAVLEEKSIDEFGEELVVTRLRSTGIYNDPNDLCMILLVGSAAALYRFGNRRAPIFSWLWLAPVTLFGYALALTQSRGGFMAMLAGLLVICRSRFGWWKTCVLGAMALPVLLVLFAGRQTNFDIENRDNTGRSRIELWSEGWQLFKEAPFFGIGKDEYAERVVQVAHNSFVHCFTELGFFGGTLFLGAFFLALRSLHQLGNPGVFFADAEMGRLRPYLMAIVVIYTVAMMSLSRAYLAPTYMVLGLSASFVDMSSPQGRAPFQRLSLRLAGRLFVLSVAFLLVINVIIRAFAH